MSAPALSARPEIGRTPLAGWARRVPPEAKVLALVVWLFAVVATPQRLVWPYAAHALVLAVVVVAVGVPARRLVTGWAMEAPFVVFALLMPFVATGPRVAVAGLQLSEAGLWAAWALLAKGTLGVTAATMLAATTRPHEFVDGLARLRVPATLVDIMRFMVRYADLVVAQWRRMGVARASRGFSPVSPRGWGTLARALGVLFVSAFERGERVHVAMLSRGFGGTMPPMGHRRDVAARWGWVALWPAAAVVVTALAWWWA